MKKYWYVYLLPMLMLLPVFVLRDYTVDNELRYLSIVDEALRNGSFFAFYNHGMPYADKPPLYFWFMMLAKWLTGEHIMWLIGLLTIIPALVIMYVMNKWAFGKKGDVTQIAPPMLALLCSVMFVGATVVIRMDMMMVMFIVLSLYSFWKLYNDIDAKRERFLLPVWIFFAIFSKGAVGILMPVAVILVFLAVERKFKSAGRYLGWRTWSILLALCAVWFSCVYIEGGTTYLDNLLFKQTVGRGVNSFHHKELVWYYLKTIWYSAAPWSLFVAVMFFKAFREKLVKSDPLIRFFTVTTLTTFVVMSLVSSKIDIYLLPIYPFFIYTAFLVLDKSRPDTLTKISVLIPSVVFALVFPALFFCESLLPVIPDNKVLIYIGGGVLSLMAIGGIVAAARGEIKTAIVAVSAGMLLCVFSCSFTIPSFNPYIGVSQLAATGVEKAEHDGINHFAYYKFRGDNMDVFLGDEPTGLFDFEELKTLADSGKPTILFVRERELNREKELSEFLGTEYIAVGQYRIYTLNAQ